jgi:hypothetical protein
MIGDEELRDRALRNLLRALQEAGPELSYSWVARGDPDLDGLRDDEAFRTLMGRMSRLDDKPLAPVSKLVAKETAEAGVIAADTKPSGTDTDLAADAAEEVADTVTRPQSPLRPAAARQRRWSLAAVLLAAAATGVAFFLGLPGLLSTPITILLVILAARAGHRAYIARKERWPELPTIEASQPDGPTAPQS